VRSASNDASKSLTAIGWLAAALVIGLLVLGVGWYQYLQIDRVTQASVRGRDNLIWDFYKLELQLANVQLALREVRAQPARSNAVAELVDEYNILVSQVQLLQTLNSGLVMRGHESFASAMVAAHAFIDKTDVYLAETPKLLTSSVVQGLLRDSAALRRPLHRLVLDAYLVENERASTELKEIRRFTVYYGLTSTFLIVLTLWAGWLVLRNLTFSNAGKRSKARCCAKRKTWPRPRRKPSRDFCRRPVTICVNLRTRWACLFRNWHRWPPTRRPGACWPVPMRLCRTCKICLTACLTCRGSTRQQRKCS